MAGRTARAFAALAGLALSLLLVVTLLFGLSVRQGTVHRVEMRATFDALPVYREAKVLRTSEDWQNLITFWQSEGVLPRVVGEYNSEHPVGAVVTFYREWLTARGWQAYQEPWSLFPAYRKDKYHLAILFKHPFPQEWLTTGDYQIHLWTLPLLEQLLGRDLGVQGHY